MSIAREKKGYITKIVRLLIDYSMIYQSIPREELIEYIMFNLRDFLEFRPLIVLCGDTRANGIELYEESGSYALWDDIEKNKIIYAPVIAQDILCAIEEKREVIRLDIRPEEMNTTDCPMPFLPMEFNKEYVNAKWAITEQYVPGNKITAKVFDIQKYQKLIIPFENEYKLRVDTTLNGFVSYSTRSQDEREECLVEMKLENGVVIITSVNISGINCDTIPLGNGQTLYSIYYEYMKKHGYFSGDEAKEAKKTEESNPNQKKKGGWQ